MGKKGCFTLEMTNPFRNGIIQHHSSGYCFINHLQYNDKTQKMKQEGKISILFEITWQGMKD
jgi:hypothetical protein